MYALEFLIRKRPRLVENLDIYIQLADVVEQCPHGQGNQIRLGKMAQEPQHGRQGSHIDRMGKGIVIIKADIRHLHQIFRLLDQVSDNTFGSTEQRRDFHILGLLDSGVCIVYLMDGGYPGVLPDDILRGRQGHIGVQGGDSYAGDA